MSYQAGKSPGPKAKLKPTLALPAAAKQRPNSMVARSLVPVTPEQRQAMIAEAAYYLALQRNFEAGHEVEDWLLAESQIEATLTSRGLPAKR